MVRQEFCKPIGVRCTSSYYQGEHPIYFLGGAIYRMTEPPLIKGGIVRLIGYLSAWAKGAERCNDEQLVRCLRSWQLKKIKSELWGKIGFFINRRKLVLMNFDEAKI